MADGCHYTEKSSISKEMPTLENREAIERTEEIAYF
jgi:hypothetical protein